MLRIEDVEITTLIENTAGRSGLVGEWGFSAHIKTPGNQFLLDTGLSGAVVANAGALGIALDRLDALVLSHGHTDHTGGLHDLLVSRRGEALRIVGHPEVFGAKYGRDRKTGRHRYAGIPFQRRALENLGASFELTKTPTWLTEDIVACGEEPMKTSFETVADNLVLAEGDGFVPDPVLDDQSLYVRTDAGLIVILGCAHRGMINIIEHAREIIGEERVHMVIGGTHLGPATREQFEATAQAIERIGITWLGVSHCTGLEVAADLRGRFREGFFFNNTGRVISFPFEN
jgi:7,8-dihydropterin-6-yl-methyl-4-(beta-D-ribofuranosyl)aminobenzene 5'-phosphate synthase